jgi:hypothetical protein
LYRLALEKSPSRDPIIGGVAASFQAPACHFPTVDTSNLGRLSISPSAKPVVTVKTHEALMELAAKVNRIAKFNLKRGLYKRWAQGLKVLLVESV